MPNINNIESPITLISYGRSGSSLLSRVFELHPDFSVVGETTNFTANLWAAYEFSSAQIAPSIVDGKWISDNERAGRMARESYLSCFPDDKKQWFHKPIGVPTVLSSKLSNEQWNEERWNEAATWYWNVINSTFPKARLFTILRHPFDVVLSAKSYWGFDEASIWKNYAILAHFLLHPLCRIEYAISYEELVLGSAGTVKSLFEFLEVPFYKEVMNAFSTVHVASRGRESININFVTRKDEWSELDNSKVNSRHVDMALLLADKYHKPIVLPADAYESIGRGVDNKCASSVYTDPDTEKLINQLISEKNQTIELLNADNSKKLLGKEREIFEIVNEYQKWISDLEEAKRWLTSERETAIPALQAQVQDLLKGNEWLATQREAWERTAAEREAAITALQAQVQDLLKGNEWLTTQREAWERTAAEREFAIIAVQAQVQDLVKANERLVAQRDLRESASVLSDADAKRLAERLKADDAVLNRGARIINFLARRKLF